MPDRDRRGLSLNDLVKLVQHTFCLFEFAVVRQAVELGEQLTYFLVTLGSIENPLEDKLLSCPLDAVGWETFRTPFSPGSSKRT